MKSENFEIKTVASGSILPTAAIHESICVCTKDGKVVFELNPNDFREVSKLCKEYFAYRYGELYMTDDELINELKHRGWKGTITRQIKKDL